MEDNQELNPRIVMADISEEMKTSYINYAMSVIISRALPDARDGLKPVHRRILYDMWELGIRYNSPNKKCARIVGDVLGKYHPHGDASVYDALVRLGQDFSLRYPVVAPQGNFGSIDGDPPAAMRYTEARMSRIGEEMLTDIQKETVDFAPNYDGSTEEPSVLPAAFPFLLTNGSSGIAVGMATNLAPHNLSEVVDGICAYIDNPDITIAELMNYIKGPDFPSYGIICGKKGIMDAYTTGKGKIVIDNTEQAMGLADYEDPNEMAVVSSMDKFTVQFALVLVVYVVSYFIMMGLSALLPSFELTLFGFNFFIGTLLTLPTKAIISKLYEKKIIKRKIVNNFMMNRIGGFAFDLMIVSGIAAIQLPLLADHWALLLIMGAFGAVATFLYIYFVSKTLHRSYMHEQFLAMFGMLTGTASTGMILLREIDGSYKTPASENLVYQTLPAMIFGFPLMLLAPIADDGTSQALLVFGIVVVLLVAFNIILFRSKIFKKRKKATESSEN